MPDIGTVLAEVTFFGDFFFDVDGNGAIGAGLDAFFFEVAAGFINEDSSVIALLDGLGRTGFHAGCIDAVHADEGRESNLLIIRLLEVTDPHAKVSEGNFVFGFAGNAARVTAGATVKVDQHASAFVGLFEFGAYSLPR